jgi:PilZ domain
MREVTCGWAGCGSGSEATLDGRRLCRNHFYDIAARLLENHRARLLQVEPAGPARIATLKFVSEVINQTTTLVASAKFLGPSQRDQFLELSLSAIEFYKRVQRNPRIPRSMPILVYREVDGAGRQELTNTVNLSKRGACITTSGTWEIGEKIWIEKPGNQEKTLAQVAWVKKGEPSQFLMGLEILDCEDFWGLESASPVKKNS